MRTKSSSFLAVAALALLPSLHAQEVPDFFGQKSSYFKEETLEGASKHAEAPTETPATVTIISREDIELYGFRTVADVLNYASIGYFTHYDRRYDFVGGRGLFFFEDFNTRLLVMMNGHPLNEPWNNFGGAGREMLIPFDLVERVEIIYGPSSLLYGGYSLYGIVNVVTRSANSLAGGRVNTTVGSWGTGEVSASWAQETDKWSAVVAGGYYKSEGESLDLPVIDTEGGTWGGPQSGTESERAPFGFVHLKSGRFSLMSRYGHRVHGAPLAPYDSVYGSNLEFIRDDKDFIELRYEQPLAKGVSLSTRVFRDWYRYEENDPYEDSVFILRGSDTDTGAEGRVTAQVGTHLMVGGVEYRTRDINQYSFYKLPDGSKDVAYEDDVNGNLLVAYFQEEWRPHLQWTLIAGGNYAKTEPGGDKAQPRVAVIYKPKTGLAIKALWGKGFRPPSIFEAAYEDQLTYVSNPDLTSEEITSSEISVMWTARPTLSLQWYAIDSKLEGLIRATVVEDDLLQYQNVGDVTTKGSGMGLRYRGDRLRGYLKLAWTRAEFDGARLPAVSDWLGSAGFGWDNGEYATSLSARWVGPQDLDPERGVEGSAGEFLEANLRGLWRTRLYYPVTLTLDVRNLFDTNGELAAIPVYVPDTVPIEGRRVLLGAEVRF